MIWMLSALALAAVVLLLISVWPAHRRPRFRWPAGRSAPRTAMDQQADRLGPWEKAALLTTGAASAFNILLWALGYTLADAAPGWTPLGVLRVVFGAVSFVAMDLVVVVVVMAFRAGRRGFWSEVAAASAALAAGLIALEVAEVQPRADWTWAWLHAAPAVVLYAFMRHLAAPRVVQAADHPPAPADHPVQVAVVQTPGRQLEAPSADQELVQVGRRVVSLGRLAATVNMPKTTLSRKLDQLTEEADHGSGS